MFGGGTVSEQHQCCWCFAFVSHHCPTVSHLQSCLTDAPSSRDAAGLWWTQSYNHSEAEITIILTQQHEEILHSECSRARQSKLQTNRACRWCPDPRIISRSVSEKCGLISVALSDASLIHVSCVQIPRFLLEAPVSGLHYPGIALNTP